MIYTVSIWLLPVRIAVTFHEAAQGFVARFLGDETASRLGRVSLNTLRHIDPFGTIFLPGLLLLARPPFLFGYAKPVPASFRALRNPRIGMVLVAAAGPAMNLGLVNIAALSFHLVVCLLAIAADPSNEKALFWNPGGASFEQALIALGVRDGSVGVIGGTNVFGMFLDRYDVFYLSRAPGVRVPDGRPVFPNVPARTPEEVLANYGLDLRQTAGA